MRRKYRKLTIRIISLICSFVVALSCFAVPAFAATEDSYIDFLVYDEYLFSSGVSYDTPSSYYYGAACTFSFGLDSSWYSCSEVIIGIDTKSETIIPRLVNVSFKNSGAKDFTYLYSEGTIHYFSYIGLIKFTDSFFVRIYFSSTFNDVVSISSFYGVEDSHYSAFDTVDASAYGFRFNETDSSFSRISLFNGSYSLPFASSLYEIEMDFEPYQSRLEYFYTFDFGDLPYSDSFVINFISTSSTDTQFQDDSFDELDFGVTLHLSDGSYSNLYFTHTSSIYDSSWRGMPVYSHSVTVDISGYDLRDSYLTCSFFVHGRWDGQTGVYYSRLDHAGYFQSVYEENFFSRIRSFFLRCFTSIESKIDSIISAIQDNSVKGSLDEAGESLGDTIDKAADQELTVNEAVSQLQADWTAEHTNLSYGFETTINRSNNAMEFISEYAQRIYDNMGWFGKVYSAVGMMSVLMLILSKSGLAHKLTHYSSSVKSGPHTGSNGGIK